MGKEISKSRFSTAEFKEFKKRLKDETLLLKSWFDEGRFKKADKSVGLELETCLVDNQYQPSPENEKFLKIINNPMVVPELSRFNIELNAKSQPLKGPCLNLIHEDLKKTWRAIQKTTKKLNLKMIMIGCLPTLTDNMLRVKNMSNMDRYRALNEHIMQMRHGRDMRIKIDGNEKIDLVHRDVMLESSCTSLQVHLQVEPDKILRYFNATLIASAFTVATAANSPYLFKKDLWDETRIPLFEQAVSLPGFFDKKGKIIRRVSFGSGYMHQSLYQFFLENLEAYPVLLPLISEKESEWLPHLKLHNGTIWRWNRPIVGMEVKGTPQFRLEHRVMAAGPTLIDIVANIAFSIGLIHLFATHNIRPQKRLKFDTARTNFYEAAQFGLKALIELDGQKKKTVQAIILNDLIPGVKKSLEKLGIHKKDIREYIDHVIVPRVQTGQNGSAWQRAFVSKHGADFQALTEEYYKLQEKGNPVHEWKV